MPRPTRARTSLPSHSRAVRVNLAGDATMEDSFDAAADAPFAAELEQQRDEVEEIAARPETKQKKKDKAYEKREALLAKITQGITPYSKSHNRRLKKAARPSEHLVTDLQSLGAGLEQLTETVEVRLAREREEWITDASALEEAQQGRTASRVEVNPGKGKEKLTGKKRQRVLEIESKRLPAIMKNPAFASDPFATIRLHTLNSMAMHQIPKSMPKKKK